MRLRESSAVDFTLDSDVVGVSIASAPLRQAVVAALDGVVAVSRTDDMSDAAVLIIDAQGDVRERLARVRRVARPDAAVIVALERASAGDVATALSAGAYACLRPPVVREELLSFVASALDSRAAKVQAADLARKLDLETHLASIGRITAGLSHEIGTPLGAAMLCVEAIRTEVERLLEGRPEAERSENLLGALDDAAIAHARLHGLLGAMRDLVRKKTSTKLERLDVFAAMQRTTKWLASELTGVEVEMIGEALDARADATLLGQILHNLVANAAQAAKTLSSPRLRFHVYESGGRVVASVRDNGPGIRADLHEKIFEPFFTTRRGNGGTGLGLALCREYALQMGAGLSFWSSPGRGTCFRVSLPSA
jgi:signal transduction histidine kinase